MTTEHHPPIAARVLIADDSPAKLTALAAALAGMDVEVVTANSGMEALQKLLKQDFAVILLDVNMPIMDGFETADMIRRRPRSEHLPIIFVTAEVLDDDARLKGYAMGAVDYIVSPVLPRVLRAKVATFADLYRLQEELREYRDHLEEVVQERTSRLEAANKDLEGFAYSVSHDLRVPLRAIDGFSQQVLKRYADKLDDEGKRYLNMVRDNTKKMAQLIDDILAFSRMGRLELSTAAINMDELARMVYEELKPRFADRELKLEIKPLPPCRGDLSMLRQVWANLLGNAIKFTKYKAAALVEVGGNTEGAELVYYVKDNGAGYDMQYADKLFGVFQRLHGNEEFEGTGIGLAIVKRIVTRHGGRVWAEGKADAGATFYFALPS